MCVCVYAKSIYSCPPEHETFYNVIVHFIVRGDVRLAHLTCDLFSSRLACNPRYAMYYSRYYSYVLITNNVRTFTLFLLDELF